MANKRGFVMLVIVACLGATACGSSKKHSATQPATTATVQTVANVGGPATTDPRTTPTDPTRKHKKNASPPTKSSSTATPMSTAAATVPASRQFRAPIPTGCLTKYGYRYHYNVEPGLLAASHHVVRHTDINSMVFVDGPYKNAAAAATAAQGLATTEYAASGGPYEVSATPRSHAQSAVAVIAACLAGRTSAKRRSSSKSYGF